MKILLFLVFLLPTNLYSFSVIAGQGYGSFSLSGASSTSFASIMSVGIRINDYLEFKYLSLDTSFRMPLLPFRVWDIKYAKEDTGDGKESYKFYDSDVMGISLILPISNRCFFSGFYGLGRSRIYEITDTNSSDYKDALMYKGLVHVGDLSVNFKIPFIMGTTLIPSFGTIVHFLSRRSGYSNAFSCYLTASLYYKIDD